ncbi:hypothetical protein B0O80DRAFT_451557 [Mortierella sp. GBAus27b]|nr:hypothetical protein B0O80DRAFT_451557 [Mortierella sp. GBAus27b]
MSCSGSHGRDVAATSVYSCLVLDVLAGVLNPCQLLMIGGKCLYEGRVHGQLLHLNPKGRNTLVEQAVGQVDRWTTTSSSLRISNPTPLTFPRGCLIDGAT